MVPLTVTIDLCLQKTAGRIKSIKVDYFLLCVLYIISTNE